MRVTKQGLRRELAVVMAQISEAQTGKLELYSTVATVAALLSKSWALRYQLASMDFDAARSDGKRAMFFDMMARASKESENWAKRVNAARKNLDVDDQADADDHDREQAELADRMRRVVQ